MGKHITAAADSMSKALVVDDSRTSAAVLGAMLARRACASDEVSSGEACLEFLETSTPDIIFMDHMMPGMDGFEAVKAIRQQPRLRDIPIVMYTSKGGELYQGQARALGAVGVLQKPAIAADVDEILSRCQRLGADCEETPPVVVAGSERMGTEGAQSSSPASARSRCHESAAAMMSSTARIASAA